MSRHRPACSALVLALLAIACAFLQRGEARAALSSLESSAVYTLRPDQGRLHVSFQLSLTGGPEPTSELAVPVLTGAANLRAATTANQPLDVAVSSQSGSSIDDATISFDPLQSGSKLDLTLDYDLTPIDADFFVVSSTYLYLPIVTIGDPATVTIDVPDGLVWASYIDQLDCGWTESIGYELACRSSDEFYVAAVAELINNTGFRSIDTTVQTEGGVQHVEIQYPSADEAWAQQVRNITTSGLPVLESIIGVPLDTRDELIVMRIGREEIPGYEGVFGCIGDEACRIGLVPQASGHVVLHELAHLWTTKHDRRWLAEGLAEFAARHATEQLGLPSSPPFSAPPGAPRLHLDQWGDLSDVIAAGEEQYVIELAGYAGALQFFNDLETTVGLDSIQHANAAADALDAIDSQDYLRVLEEASGRDLGEMFLGRVFPDSFKKTLDQRVQARERLFGLAASLAGTDLDLHTETIVAAIDDWNFYGALDQIADATIAINAYRDARAAAGDVSWWQRLGLIGKDPGGKLDDARAAFAEGDFTHAKQYAATAKGMYDAAGETARTRVAIAFGLVVLVGVVIVGGAWAFRGDRAV
jgi:hypothetical protein